MLPILLTILKILGLVILALFGLVAAVLLIVLLVPVRYGLSGSFHERLQAKVKITWLLRGVSVTVTYDDKLDIAIRLFGRKLFQEKADKEEIKDEWEELEEEWQDLEDQWEASESGKTEEEKTLETDRTQDRGRPADVERQTKTKKPQPESAGSSTHGSSEMEQDWTEEPDRRSDSSSDQNRVWQAINSAKDKWDQLSGYKERILAFVKDPKNQKTGKLIFRQVKKLIRHVLPTKVQGKVVFGFDDPAFTGKVLSGLSILYAWYGDKVEIVPVFDQKILEVDGSLKGRLRLGTMLALVVRVFLNKNFRRLLRRFLKEWR